MSTSANAQALLDRMLAIANEGYAARDAGAPLIANPYQIGTAERGCWAHGWRERNYEIPSIAEQIEDMGYACGWVADGFQCVWVER